MCSHYQTLKDNDRYRRLFGVEPPGTTGPYDIWPGYSAGFIRLARRSGDEPSGVEPAWEALQGPFGLIPHWARDATMARRTFNARSETVAEKPSFRDAWRQGQRCIIPAEAVFEPDWRSGKSVATRIARADGQAMGLAGLWSRWTAPDGAVVHSFSMLTINADDHGLMRQFHKPGEEKRMVVVLPSASYAAWLSAPVDQAAAFLLPCPPSDLVTTTAVEPPPTLF